MTSSCFPRFRRPFLISVAVAAVVASLSRVPLIAQAKDAAKDLFKYDYSKNFDLKKKASETRENVVIEDIDYASFQNRHLRIKAYLVRPKGAGPFAGVVFFHWLGEKKSDRTEFLDEAVELARRGTVSLLIQGFFPWSEPPTEGSADRQKVIDQTIEVRRAIDLLLLQPGADANRIGFVGHDYGAMFGAITAGLEHRAKAYVLIAGNGSFADWSLKYWPKTAKKGEEAYREAVSPLAPMDFVKAAAPASLLFQFSNKDKYIPQADADSFFQAASEPKTIRWYDTDHQLGSDAVTRDRATWLAERLSLTGPAAVSSQP